MSLVSKTVLVQQTAYVEEPHWRDMFYGSITHITEHTLFVIVTNRINEHYMHAQIVAVDLHDRHFRVLEAAP